MLRRNERVERFAIRTWGVDYLALCRMPQDWEMGVGRSGPGGKLEGVASHGASYIAHPAVLRALALVRLRGPVQKQDKHVPGGVVPATFAGSIHTSGFVDEGRTLRLDHRNVRLTPATGCAPTRD